MARSQQSGWDILLHLFPTSIVDAMARGDILQIVVFATIFGVALAAIGEKGRPLVELLDSLAQVMFTFTGYVMRFAPVGVMAAIAATVGGRGLAILVTLGKLVLRDVRVARHLRAAGRRRRVASSSACRSSRSCGRSASRS